MIILARFLNREILISSQPQEIFDLSDIRTASTFKQILLNFAIQSCPWLETVKELVEVRLVPVFQTSQTANSCGNFKKVQDKQYEKISS